MSHDRAMEEWLNEARAVTVMELLGRWQVKLAGGNEKSGPCPGCGGTDRFWVNARKNVWMCRKSGVGGDAIALVQHKDGCDFLAACEDLVGRPPPNGGEGTRLSAEELQAREEERRKKQAADEAAANRYREWERQALYRIFQGGERAHEAAMLRAYFELRSILLPSRCKALRFVADAPYFHGQVEDERGRKRPRLIYRGPAITAAITDSDRVFRGLHFTWLDLSRPKGKAEIFDPETGELLPAKKVRGSQLGHRIELVPAPSGRALHTMAGEGYETTFSVWSDLVEANWSLADTEFVAGINLGNLVGGATATVAHPTERVVDSLGRSRPCRVPGPVPNMDTAAMWLPESVQRLTYLADGDSDPFTTRCAMERGETRHAVQGRQVSTAWAPEGMDFNDLRRRRHLPDGPAGRAAA